MLTVNCLRVSICEHDATLLLLLAFKETVGLLTNPKRSI